MVFRSSPKPWSKQNLPSIIPQSRHSAKFRPCLAKFIELLVLNVLHLLVVELISISQQQRRHVNRRVVKEWNIENLSEKKRKKGSSIYFEKKSLSRFWFTKKFAWKTKDEKRIEPVRLFVNLFYDAK